MTKIEAILFDFGGTLDNDGADWFMRMHRGIVRQGVSIAEEEFYLYAKQAANDICELEDTPSLLMDELLDRLLTKIHAQMAGDSNGGLDGWSREQVAAEFMSEARSCLARSREVLARLRGRFRLGVISNNWGNTAGWCEQFGLGEMLETMIDSTVVGASKPDKRIFEAALADLNLPAEACVYVGDKYECDICGAYEAGFKTVWVTGLEDVSCPDEGVIGCRVKGVSDLPGIRLDQIRRGRL